MSDRVDNEFLHQVALYSTDSRYEQMARELIELRNQARGENIALIAVTQSCCAALGKEVQPAFLADEIEELRKRLADAALVEQELREELAAMKAPKCKRQKYINVKQKKIMNLAQNITTFTPRQ